MTAIYHLIITKHVYFVNHNIQSLLTQRIMKKLFTCIAALMAAVAINATQVTLNPASMPQQTTAGEYDKTVNGIRVQITRGIVNTSEMRTYKNETITLTAESDISAIVFTCTASGDAQYGPGCFDAQEGYSYDGNKGTWLGSAKSVSFKAGSNQVRASKIVVYLDGEQPSSEVVPLDTISVSDAIARIKDGKTDECCVKGVVAGDPFLLGANGPAFYLTDIENPNDSLEGYKIGKDANTAYKDVEEMSQDIAMGDTIIICALGLAKYNNIFETTGGYYVRTVGKFKAIELDWAAGEATRFADHWELSIAKVSGNEQNVIKLAFASDKVDAIAGNHYLAQGSSITIDGAETAITSGSVKLTFKEQGGTGLNTYVTKVKAVAGDDIYVLSGDIEFYAQDEEFEEIDLVGDRPFVPTVDGQDVTCEQARSYALSLDAGASSDLTVTVHGFVTDLFSNGVTFWMADQQGTEKVIQAYSSVLPVGVALQNGTEVKVKGKVTNYNGTPEINKGTVEVISGGGVVTVLEVNVAGALAACQALAQNATSTETYAITGFIINIAREYSEQYGNMSFWMSDNASDEKGDFEAYNVKCDATLAAKLLPGAKVKVTDKLKHFHQDATEGDNPKPERTVYETLGGGSVELLAGAGVEDITVNVKAAKFIYDGQLYILRDNAIYNVQGQRVK